MLCSQGKRSYATMEAAERAMTAFFRQWGEADLLAENLNAYHCMRCGKYHLGHRGGKTSDQRLLEDIRRLRHRY